MTSNSENRTGTARTLCANERVDEVEATDWKLRRRQVSFRSGQHWSAVGEFVALDAPAAIERAIEVFGCTEEHKADEIPWDAAPLPRLNPAAQRPTR